VIPRKVCEQKVEELIDDITVGSYSGHWIGSESYQADPNLYVTSPLEDKVAYEKLALFVDKLLSYPIENRQQKTWLDDTPINIINSLHVSNLFEQANIIHVYRNPLDVVSSYTDTDQEWAPNDCVAASKWVGGIMSSWFKQRCELDKTNYIEVAYEDLIYDQEKQMHRICEFVGIPFNPRLLSESIDNRSVDRYRNDISNNKLDDVVDNIRHILEEYDEAYQRSDYK